MKRAVNRLFEAQFSVWKEASYKNLLMSLKNLAAMEETKFEESPTSSKRSRFRLSLSQLKGHTKQNSAKVIDNLEELYDDFTTTSAVAKRPRKSITEAAIEGHRITEKIFACIRNGTQADLEAIEDLLSGSPLAFLRDKSDPESIVNKANIFGIRPIYEASRCGNLKVVQLLYKMGANIHMLSHLGSGDYESSFEVACRWRYVEVVNWILENCQLTYREVRNAYRQTSHVGIRKAIKLYYKGAFVWWRCFPCFNSSD